MNITGEFDELDFKKEYIETSKLAKHIIAMANTQGGMIIFGLEENDKLIPIGLDKLKDHTELKEELSNYLPLELEYEIFDFEYDNNTEWKEIKNKSFQIIIIEFNPEFIPFLSKDGKNITTDIYCRKNSSTSKVEYNDLQRILNIRNKQTINKNNTFYDDIEQLQILFYYLNTSSIINSTYRKLLLKLITKKGILF